MLGNPHAGISDTCGAIIRRGMSGGRASVRPTTNATDQFTGSQTAAARHAKLQRGVLYCE